MLDFAINRLKYLLNRFPPKYAALSEDDLSHKPFPKKWSKKEIVGHLIDSATFNHHRFINAITDAGITKIVPYDQELMVVINNYQEKDSKEILAFWLAYNKHLLHFFLSIPPNKYSHHCDIGNPDLVSLEWLINDYVDHLEHHINQVLK